MAKYSNNREYDQSHLDQDYRNPTVGAARNLIYEGSRYASAVKGPTKEPDEISREIVSTSELCIADNSGSLTFLAETSSHCVPRVFRG